LSVISSCRSDSAMNFCSRCLSSLNSSLLTSTGTLSRLRRCQDPEASMVSRSKIGYPFIKLLESCRDLLSDLIQRRKHLSCQFLFVRQASICKSISVNSLLLSCSLWRRLSSSSQSFFAYLNPSSTRLSQFQFFF